MADQNTLGEGKWRPKWQPMDSTSTDWKSWPRIVFDGDVLCMAYAPPRSNRAMMIVDVHFGTKPKAVLFRLPDVFESTKCAPGFVEPGLDILLGTAI